MKREIFYQQWKAEKPIAGIYLIHGLGEHSGRYEHVAKFLNGRGVSVYTGDLPGFGRTKGRRGDVASFRLLTEAVWEGWQGMLEETVELPHFLLGHSMGGLLTLHLLLTFGEVKPDGVILSSPALISRVAVPRWKQKLADLLTPIFPTLTLPSGISPASVSRDLNIVEASKRDPYNHPLVSLRFYRDFTRTMEEVLGSIERLPKGAPFLVMQAGDDQLVDPKGAREVAHRLPPHPLHQYIEWPGLYHEILNEPEKEEVMARIAEFIDRVLESKEQGFQQKTDDRK